MVARVTRLVAEKFVLSTFPRALTTLSSMCSRAVRALESSPGLMMMDRRGFKSWCENAALEYRSHLGLNCDDPLDPRDLARHLGVLVWTPREVPDVSEQSIEQLTEVDPSSWSAVTVTIGEQNLVIFNTAHAQTRQRNSLAHELAHVILNHHPTATSISEEGFLFRDRFDTEQEEEADWLAGSLLLPRDGLLSVYQRTSSTAGIARTFGVSTQLVEWRLRMTGIIRQTERASRKWRRPAPRKLVQN